MYKPFGKAEIDEFRGLLTNNDGWKEVMNKKGTALYTQPVEKGMKFKFTTMAFKDVEPLEFYDMQNDLEFMKTLDNNVILRDIVAELDPCQAVIHQVSKMPLFDPRDMVIQILKYRNKDDTEIIIMMRSVETDIQPVKDSIRAVVYNQGFRLYKTPEGTVFSMYGHTDMGGKMSGMNGETQLKMMAKGMPKKMKENYEKFRKFNEKHKDRAKPWMEKKLDWMNE